MTRPRGSGRGSGGWSAVADLRRLRAHGVIERIPRTHRYHITPGGIRQALAPGGVTVDLAHRTHKHVKTRIIVRFEHALFSARPRELVA